MFHKIPQKTWENYLATESSDEEDRIIAALLALKKQQPLSLDIQVSWQQQEAWLYAHRKALDAAEKQKPLWSKEKIKTAISSLAGVWGGIFPIIAILALFVSVLPIPFFVFLGIFAAIALVLLPICVIYNINDSNDVYNNYSAAKAAAEMTSPWVIFYAKLEKLASAGLCHEYCFNANGSAPSLVQAPSQDLHFMEIYPKQPIHDLDLESPEAYSRTVTLLEAQNQLTLQESFDNSRLITLCENGNARIAYKETFMDDFKINEYYQNAVFICGILNPVNKIFPEERELLPELLNFIKSFWIDSIKADRSHSPLSMHGCSLKRCLEILQPDPLAEKIRRGEGTFSAFKLFDTPPQIKDVEKDPQAGAAGNQRFIRQ